MSQLDAVQQAVLRSGHWFGALPGPLQSCLWDMSQGLALPAGQCLFARGDPPDGLYAVLSGGIRITAVSPQGKEAILSIVEAPQWFGEIALFDGQPRTHDAWAETPVQLRHCPQADLLALLDREPSWWPFFGRLLASKVRLLFNVLEDAALLPAHARLARRLLTMLEAQAEMPGGPSMEIRVPQEQLGMMLGLTRQTVNQILRHFEREGAVELQRGVIAVRSPQRLQALSH